MLLTVGHVPLLFVQPLSSELVQTKSGILGSDWHDPMPVLSLDCIC
jgi:hypothetical protein